jgi:hypothetical protein
LRLAGEAVCSLGPLADGVGERLPRSRAVLAGHVRRVVASGQEPGAAAPTSANVGNVGREVVAALRRELPTESDVGDLPARLLWTSMYVQDIERSSTM